MITKEYFLNKLNAGENIDTIGQELADMMNEALSDYEAEKKTKAAEEEKNAAKRDLIQEMIEIIQEYAILEGIDPNELAATDEEIDRMVEVFTGTFAAVRSLKALTNTPTIKTSSNHNDDQILADFLKMFN